MAYYSILRKFWPYLVCGAVIVGLTIALVATRSTLHGVRQWQGSVISATSTAAGVTDGKGKPSLLDADDVPLQIKLLGDALNAVRGATEKAKQDNAENNTRIERAQDAAAKETANDIDQKLAAARAAGAADYARRVREQGAGAADRGNAGQAGAGGAADTARGADGAGGMSVMDEDNVRICSDNTVKAIGWQEYTGRINSIPQ